MLKCAKWRVWIESKPEKWEVEGGIWGLIRNLERGKWDVISGKLNWI
jgi:hypothetical protein